MMLLLAQAGVDPQMLWILSATSGLIGAVIGAGTTLIVQERLFRKGLVKEHFKELGDAYVALMAASTDTLDRIVGRDSSDRFHRMRNAAIGNAERVWTMDAERDRQREQEWAAYARLQTAAKRIKWLEESRERRVKVLSLMSTFNQMYEARDGDDDGKFIELQRRYLKEESELFDNVVAALQEEKKNALRQLLPYSFVKR
ncbi:MAG TPA: hypothetical protein VD971_11950 [Phycisphaerales bacterium]|nr:hypothetical protein [Phycisphaerales bacterium]